MPKTSIFYENSYGIMCQWYGHIEECTPDSITIKFKKYRIRRYLLKTLGIDFVLVTKRKVPDMPEITKPTEMYGFDASVRDKIIKEVGKNNIAYHWQNGQWIHAQTSL